MEKFEAVILVSVYQPLYTQVWNTCTWI